ncbi:MAG: response regulator transcription factor [Pseudomonadota bacterium]
MQHPAIKDTEVFIVDDSSVIRERLLGMLGEIDGISVVGEAESSAEAITGIIRTCPDVVMLDIHLRNGSGLDVLRGLQFSMSGIVFIVLTNFPTSYYRKVYMEAGASHFLDKHTEFKKAVNIIIALRSTRH